MKSGKSLVDVSPVNQENEQQMAELATRMESLVGLFFTWNSYEDSDPVTFLETAKAVLMPDDSIRTE